MELEDKNVKLNLELFSAKEELKFVNDEKTRLMGKISSMGLQIEDIVKENKKWKEQHD